MGAIDVFAIGLTTAGLLAIAAYAVMESRQHLIRHKVRSDEQEPHRPRRRD
ncbi:hypothetical protein [Litchfieldella rifensis]|uniref:Uncharacterized protein n=1 Tax=Litchfieldella rifensis TaxID=762643 RepID=A0ABV7LQV6_9GAMM